MHHYDWDYKEAFTYLNDTQRVTPYRYFKQSLKKYDVERQRKNSASNYDFSTIEIKHNN